MAKQPNYTDEQVAEAVQMYGELGNEGLDAIAEKLEKSVASVRSKLVREGVYKASPKGAVKADRGPTKKEMLRELEQVSTLDVKQFQGATKEGIAALIGLFQEAE